MSSLQEYNTNMQRESSSIIHGYDGHYFQRHYFNEDSRSSLFFSEAHRYRLKCYYIEQQDLLSDKFNVPRYWKSRKYLQPNKWLETWLRREVQALIQEENVDIIVHHIVGVIDSFRRNDERSILKQEEFKGLISEAARPFLTGRTDRFVKEVEGFLASGFTVEAYDRVYLKHLGWKVNGIMAFRDEEEEEEEKEVITTHLTSYLSVFDSDEIV
ncbi:uncharacterized protein LOC124942133 isoform X2 [Impatiens glandulifera]|uniref:uncharacterized protein LOC124942133 isoform X2 n=1 Tax=Impatiens glandulifera TaxID=253017 RepID=UPI001FB0A661|nr:uncharacterized protein LOC124942133 isoform X2 [Impatiens glandulifera]